jgi:hypothetical protein
MGCEVTPPPAGKSVVYLTGTPQAGYNDINEHLVETDVKAKKTMKNLIQEAGNEMMWGLSPTAGVTPTGGHPQSFK